MPPDKHERLQQTIAGLQGRFGVRAVRRLDGDHARPILPTGFPALDAALGLGGLPRGRLTELIGVPTAGLVTPALRIAARGQRDGQTAFYLDLYHDFDPDYASRCGVDPERLALIRPRQALAIVEDIVFGGERAILVVDMPFAALLEPATARQVTHSLSRLLAPLDRSGATLLWLTALPAGGQPTLVDYPPISLLLPFVAIRLLIRREDWLYHRDDIRGYRAEVRVVKNKFAPPGRRAGLELAFIISDEPPPP